MSFVFATFIDAWKSRWASQVFPEIFVCRQDNIVCTSMCNLNRGVVVFENVSLADVRLLQRSGKGNKYLQADSLFILMLSNW